MPDPITRLAVSPTEAARALGVCRTTIYRLLHDGELRSYKVGRRNLIPLADVERLIGGAR